MKFFKKSRNICVIGLGRFGTAVVEELLSDEHNNIRLALIDTEEKSLFKFKDQVASIYVADAADQKTLEAINITDFDAVIVASSDNIEIVASLAEIGVTKIIARATSNRHARVLKQIGVSQIIRPEEEAGKRTALIVSNPNFTTYSESLIELQDDYVTGSLFVTNPKMFNQKLKDLGFRNKYHVSVVLVKRNSQTFLPSGDFELNEGDLLTIIGKVEHVSKVFEYCRKS
ncbi:potassium uptake protein [Metamycoplasma cloacale]|uniref:TrkA family potassium uptake protein n=1 Tax=Metamycoplasma cloacale TaxID=92401 RepID=A0A2Z4LM49_9BACT|nr:TrkA family potassium uptake protein [Metamycoplasma cloacale]AWX42871.1 TrkA family potassium uptake protein [Metamycoplasma cloacale]VEU79306.1 potassium uptake protein [Metamycoplasma cloacale]